jgi:hypothetical protein
VYHISPVSSSSPHCEKKKLLCLPRESNTTSTTALTTTRLEQINTYTIPVCHKMGIQGDNRVGLAVGRNSKWSLKWNPIDGMNVRSTVVVACVGVTAPEVPKQSMSPPPGTSIVPELQ